MKRFASHATQTGGFTLPEAMMGLAIGSILMTGILTTYIFSLKGYHAVTNYTLIHSHGRRAIDYYAKDIRAVSKINTLSSNSNLTTLSIVIPTTFNNSGNVTASNIVTYTCHSCINNDGRGVLRRTESTTGTTTTLATNIYHLSYILFDHVGSNTPLTSIAKGLQVDIKLRKQVISKIQSEDYLSARLDMRNK